MNASTTKVYVRQFSEIAMGLPEKKLEQIVAFARNVKKQVEKKPAPFLSTEEILALASNRAIELRRQSRPVVEAQYRTLIQALEAEISAKGIEVEEHLCGD